MSETSFGPSTQVGHPEDTKLDREEEKRLLQVYEVYVQ